MSAAAGLGTAWGGSLNSAPPSQAPFQVYTTVWKVTRDKMRGIKLDISWGCGEWVAKATNVETV